MINWLTSDTDMFTFAEDNGIQTITNPCNCVGAWKAGISKQCGIRYPTSIARYKRAVSIGGLRPGKLHLSRQTDAPNILYFPTKDHWRDKSKIEWIEQGLQRLLDKYKTVEIESIVIPPLGCGYGGLKWADVRVLIVSYLSNVDMEVYVIEKG